MRPEPETLFQWLKPEPTPRELEAVNRLKPGDYEIYSSKLDQILAEGREAFIRMGVSGMIRSGDLAVNFFTSGGDLVTSSCGTFLHSIPSQLPVKFIIKNYMNEPTVGIREGDIFYFNDAAYGGIHNPDQVAIMPIFSQAELIGWCTTAVHQAETGGSRPGGMIVTARTKYEEGMRIPPLKIGENYQLRADVMEMFTNFIGRAPHMQELDMKARVTGCNRVRRRIQELAVQTGNDFTIGLMRRMIQVAEEGARNKIKRWNDGIYRAVVFCDALGEEEALHRFFLTLRKQGDRLIFDFAGTSPEHDLGSYHATPASMPAYVSAVAFNYPFHDLPISCGSMVSMEWVTPPKGTLLNPAPDAAVSCAPVLCTILLSAIYLCFAKAQFSGAERDSIVAPTATGCGANVSGTNQYGVPFADMLSYPVNAVGQGARVDMDGVNSYGFVYAPQGRGSDLDEVEAEKPFIHLMQRHLKDSCGFGKYRSGVGVISVYAVHDVPEMVYSMTARETRIPGSPGLFGGYPACAKFGLEISNSNLWQKMQRGDKDIPSNFRQLLTERAIKGDYVFQLNVRPARAIRHGDIWVIMQSGTGGYGDVLERDPELVMSDLRDEIISHWTARNVYKVAYDPQTLEADYEKTAALRQAEREDRLRRGRRYREFVEEWLEKRPPESALKCYGSWPDAQQVRKIRRL